MPARAASKISWSRPSAGVLDVLLSPTERLGEQLVTPPACVFNFTLNLTEFAV